MQHVSVDKKNIHGDTVLIQCLKAMTEEEMLDERYDFLENTALALVEYGADHASALEFAIRASHHDMVQVLIDKDVETDVYHVEEVRRRFVDEDVLHSWFGENVPDPEIIAKEAMEEIPEGDDWPMKPRGAPPIQAVFCVTGDEKTLYACDSVKTEKTLLYMMLEELEDLKLNNMGGERVDFLVQTALQFIDPPLSANVKTFYKGRALLDVAINTDELEIVTKIVNNLDDIDCLDHATGSTVLYRLLTQRKQRLESNDHAMQMLVARREDFVHDVANLLLTRGTELHISGPHGSLFDCAIGCGTWEVCSLILEQSSVYGFCDKGSVPFLHKVLMSLDSPFVRANGADAKEIVENMAITLIDRGCDINQPWEGKQPLDVAIVYMAQEVFKHLLAKGSTVSRTIIYQMLQELLQEEEKERVEFLERIIIVFIECGTSDVDCEVDGVAPLQLAIKSENYDIMEKIIDKSTKLGYPSHVGRDLLNSILIELAAGNATNHRMDYFKKALPRLARRGWFVLQETMAACGDSNPLANELVLYGIEQNADPVSPNPEAMNETPLHAAAANGLKTIMLKLLALGAKVDALNDVGETPLIKACLHNQQNVIQLLLEHGANINATSSGAFCNMGPMHIAAATERPAMIEILLRNSPDVNKPGHFGRTPLHEAFYTSKAHPEVSEELVYALMESGADVNRQDVDGVSPFMLAAKCGMLAVVRQMLERGADVSTTDNVGDTVYDYAIHGMQHGILVFIMRRYPLDEKLQKRIIMHAIRSGMPGVLEELLEVGGRANVLDTRAGPHPVVINVTWDEPLWWAAYFGRADLCANLLSVGCNVAVHDQNNHSLFHWCSLWGLPSHSSVLEVLCKVQSPAANASDVSGKTPFDIAVEMGNVANAVLLGGEEGRHTHHRKASSWEEAKQIANETGMPYCDPDFGANLQSLCMKTAEPVDLNPRFSTVEWKRPKDLVDGSVPRLDLAQLSQVELGCCGNAWLLSSVLVAMDTPNGLTAMFEQREIVKEGCYSFKFRFGDAEMKVLIDDRVPCLNGSPMYGGLSRVNNNIAFMLLEKALAKLVGSYEGLAKGAASEEFKVSPIGQILYDICKPPDFVEDEELTELVQEVCKSATVMMLESSCAMYGEASSPATLAEITEFFTQEVTPAGMGINQNAKHIWAAEPKKVLPGTGSCSCQEPVVTLQVNVKSRVRVELGDQETAENVRVYQTAAEGEHWVFVWRHAVPGSSTEFDLLLEPCVHPYIIYFTQMGNDSSSKPVHFNLWSDKEIVVGMVDNNEDLVLDIQRL